MGFTILFILTWNVLPLFASLISCGILSLHNIETSLYAKQPEVFSRFLNHVFNLWFNTMINDDDDDKQLFILGLKYTILSFRMCYK